MERRLYPIYWPLAYSFNVGSVHTARAKVRNPSSGSHSYQAELYLGTNPQDKAASATASFSLSPNEERDVDFTVTMPGTVGTYHVYLDVYVSDELVAAYISTEDVMVVELTWECLVCGAMFATYDDLRAHLDTQHPDGFQVGTGITNVMSTSARLGAAGSRACRLGFWLRNPDGKGIKVGERTSYSTDVFWVIATGLTPSTMYDFIALGVDASNKVGRGYGYFTTEAAPLPPQPGDFAYNNFVGSTHPVPGESYAKYIEVSCDIKNTTPSTQTRTVALFISNENTIGWEQITYPSFAGWESWAIPLGTWNAGTMTLTLGPGGVFHFHYGGYGAAPTNYLQLRDDGGGASKTITVYR